MGNYPGTNHGNVTVIDGATNSITTVTDPNALSPAGADSRGFAVAVNSVTNRIYVTNEGSNNVTVIDGATNSITTVTDPNAIAPIAVAVDAVTSMIYVVNSGTNLSSLTVINGATNVATTVIDPEGSWDAVALNLKTNRIYVADSGDCVCDIGNNVAVIDGGATATSHTLLLGVKGNGSGTVTSSPAGINCTASCTASFAAGTAVSLSASPASGSEFSGWKMACAGTSSCNVTMRSDVVVTATFIAPDFSVRLASEILTAQRGSQVTDAVTIAPLNGTSFGEAIQLSCAVTAVQLPSIATGPIPTCALSPSSVTPGASSATSMLTITAPTSSAGLMPPLGRLSSPLYGVFLPISFALIGFGRAVSKQRRRQLWLRCGLFLGFIAIQAGCGGGSGNQQMQPQNYIVIVTGTSGAIQHTAQATVTVP
jgi:YVTN family beta-propeller protein